MKKLLSVFLLLALTLTACKSAATAKHPNPQKHNLPPCKAVAAEKCAC